MGPCLGSLCSSVHRENIFTPQASLGTCIEVDILAVLRVTGAAGLCGLYDAVNLGPLVLVQPLLVQSGTKEGDAPKRGGREGDGA